MAAHLLLIMRDGQLARRIADDLVEAFGSHVVIAPSLRIGRLLHARGGWAGILVDRSLRHDGGLARLVAQNERFGHAPLAYVAEAGNRVQLTGDYDRLEALVPVLDHAWASAA